MKRIIALIMSLMVVCSLFAACGEKKDGEKSKKAPEKKTILVEGTSVNSKIYSYYYHVESLNNPDATQEQLEEAAVKQAARITYIAQKCKEMGITVDDEGKKTIELQIDAQINQYGSKEEFEKEMGQFGLDYDTFYSLMESYYLENLYKTEVTSKYTDQQRREFYDNEMMNVQHILVMTVNENNEPLDEQSIKDKKAIAQDCLNRVKEGADFNEMIGEYNEDPGVTPDGYMICKYTGFVKPFLDAALKLEVGQVTDLVETSYGYHIIKRNEHKGNETWYEGSISDIDNALFEKAFDEWYEKSDIVVE